MRSIFAAVVVLASCSNAHVSPLPCGTLVVGGGPEGLLLVATAGRQCEGPTLDETFTLTMKDVEPEHSDERVLRADGVDDRGRPAAIQFEFHEPRGAWRSGLGRMTVISGDETVVVENARFAPLD